MSTTELRLFEASRIHCDRDKLFNKTLHAIFPNNTEEQKLATARTILELPATEYSDEKLAALLADFDFIANAWLDTFERQQFNGKTLTELLKK